MKRLMFYLSLGIIASTLLIYACTTQRPVEGVAHQTLPDSFGTKDYSRHWEKISDYQADERPRSVIETAEKVYKKAYKDQNPVQQIRAMITIQEARSSFEEEAQLKNIAETKEKLRKESYFPVKSIMHSILAQQYFEYYRTNQYRVGNRSSAKEANTDPSTWGGNTFYDTIAHHFIQSLKPASKLQEFHVSAFKPLLTGDSSTRDMRPSLLDLLSHRALNFFEEDMPFKALPANEFLIDDLAFFAPAPEFANASFQTPDSTARLFQATKIYQNLIRHHGSDSVQNALVYTSLKRLRAMHEKAALPSKDSLYYKALDHLANNYPENSVTAEVYFEKAQLVDQGYQPPDYSSNRPVRQIALSICEDAIEKYPGTYGTKQCMALKAQIERPRLNIQTENTYLPREPSKFLLNYKELDSIYYSIIPLDRKSYLDIKQLNGEVMLNALKSRKPIYKLGKKLPLPLDYKEHSIEMGLPGLEKGPYVLLVSSGSGYKVNEDLLEANFIQVTQLGLVQMDQRNKADQSFYVLDAKTGNPEKDAGIEVMKRQYNRSKQGYDYNQITTKSTDENGQFAIDQTDERIYLKIYKGADTFFPEDPIFKHRQRSRNRETINGHTFTDRSIYRPGQTIHFKTLIRKSREQGTEQTPVTGDSVEVQLKDVNNQKVASKTFQTNEFGAFAGKFEIPEATLTGYYRIQTPYGSQSISVEAYKRPQFEVKLEDLTDAYQLGEAVNIRGSAASYSGVPLEKVEVRYQVKRKARFPYWYWRIPVPSTSEKIIETGKTVTDQEGAFAFNFTAKPDPTIERDNQPIFRYEVKVDVINATGETQSTQQSIKAGYAAYYPTIQMEEWQQAGKPLQINTRIENAGGKAVDQEGKLTIQQLKQPQRLFREQHWKTPDQYLEDFKAYKAKYPYDPFKSEDQPENWKTRDTLIQTKITENGSNTLQLKEKGKLKPGYYKADFTVDDEDHPDTRTVQYFKVYREEPESVAVRSFSYLIPLQKQTEPGKNARFIWGSADEDAKAIVHVEQRGNIIQQEKLSVSKGQRIIEIPIKEEHRGNLQLHVFSANENRLVTHHESIKVPWSNKKLDINLETFRSTITPGQNETWTLTVKNPNGTAADAELLAGMYDASLDAIKKHQWNFDIFPTFGSNIRYETPSAFSANRQSYLNYLTPSPYRQMPQPPGREFEDLIQSKSRWGGRIYSIANEKTTANAMDVEDAETKNTRETGKAPDTEDEAEEAPAIRTKLQETAFFKPQLRPGKDGNVEISFESPEALTRWKLMLLAHDRELANGYLEKEVVTQKQLMVEPYLPRFLRSGDQVQLKARISNLTGSTLKGPATLSLFDARTGEPVEEAFDLTEPQQEFILEPNSSKTLTWSVQIPDTIEAVTYRFTANAGKHKDGQEAILPILPQKEFVTESLPLWLTGSGSQTFSFDRIAESQSSTTLRNHRVTLEMASNPAWYAVQALPSILEPQFENTDQIFTAFYANSLASHILASNPEIQKIFRQWEDSGALGSNLQKNQALKAAELSETPWVKEARNETEMQQQIGELFNKAKVKSGLNQYIDQLRQLQLSNGAWPWFEGMKESPSITYYILGGLGRLEALNALPESQQSLGEMKGKAISYADQSMQERMEKLLKRDTTKGRNYLTHEMVRCLYARSFYTNKPIEFKQAFGFWLKQAKKHWGKESLMNQAMIALAMYRYGEKETAETIMTSLREKALHDEEMGMYWAANKSGYHWHEAPIETQALLIEAFKTIEDDDQSVEAMKAWLLKQKQVQSWKTSKATADACYALLMEGTDWLSETATVKIQLGGKPFDIEEKTSTLPGTGYFKHTLEGNAIDPEKFREVTLSKTSDGIAWGAIHWQYFENPAKITAHETPVSVEKKLYIQENTNEGETLEPLNAGQFLNKGDLVKVRLILKSDRAMDFFHLKDHRASALEPVKQLSGYRYNSGLGYYRNIKDASANFFFDHLPKGTHVFEYNLRVSHSGKFQNGTASIQSMYAPEFNSHSEGRIIKVK